MLSLAAMEWLARRLQLFLLTACFFTTTLQTGDYIGAEEQATGPCDFPSPTSATSSHELTSLCQLPYHNLPYLCDPSGMLSRTFVFFCAKTHTIHNWYGFLVKLSFSIGI